MRFFLTKTVIFLLIATTMIFGILLTTGLLMKKKTYYKIEKDKIYLGLGHSQLECALNDSLIPAFQNLSQSGESFFFTYLKLKKIIEVNPQIQMVFIGFSNNQIEKSMDSWAYAHKYLSYRLPKYASLLGSDDFSFLLKHNPKTFISTLNIVLKDNLKFLFGRNKNIIKALNFGGFLPLYDSKTDALLKKHEFFQDTLKKSELSIINLAYLDEIVSLCRNSGVQVILMRPPLHVRWEHLANETAFDSILSTRYKHVDFIDFRDFPLQNQEFKDLQHLNIYGANSFSHFFNTLIEDGLLQSNNKRLFVIQEMDRYTAHTSDTNKIVYEYK